MPPLLPPTAPSSLWGAEALQEPGVAPWRADAHQGDGALLD